jgi:hypothetical protein
MQVRQPRAWGSDAPALNAENAGSALATHDYVEPKHDFSDIEWVRPIRPVPIPAVPMHRTRHQIARPR